MPSGHHKSGVDESLFGSKQGSARSTARKQKAGVMSKGKLSNLLANPLAAPDSVILTTAEIQKMRDASVIITESELRARKSSERRQLLEKRKGAVARKERIQRLEIERKKKAMALEDAAAGLSQQKTSVVLQRAKEMRDEDLDDIKHMNQLVLYAQCVTIRDQQKKEKVLMEQREKEEEKRLDLVMDIHRVEQLKAYERSLEMKRIEQAKGAVIIREQIEARERIRMREKELREQEAEAMLQRIRDIEAEQEQKQRDKVERGKRLVIEVLKANEAQSKAKLLRKKEQEAEDAYIAKYIKEKELREVEEEAEKERIRAAKEREVAQLRAAQEKVQDSRAELDELRARRYQEARDRKWREAEMEKQRKHQKMQDDLHRVRNEQRAYKMKCLEMRLEEEKITKAKTEEWQRKLRDREELEERRAHEQRVAYKEMLQKQIRKREEKREKAKADNFVDGGNFKKAEDEERRRLEGIKMEKIRQLKAQGVPDKYLTELYKKKCLQFSLHTG